MAKAKLVTLNFSYLTIALQILEHYRISLSATSQPRINRDHLSLKERLQESITSSQTPLKKYVLTIPVREIVYLKKITYQYFIALLKEDLYTSHNEYHELYKKLNTILENDFDEINDILKLLQK